MDKQSFLTYGKELTEQVYSFEVAGKALCCLHMTSQDRIHYETRLYNELEAGNTEFNPWAWCVTVALCNEHGDRIFTDGDYEDVAACSAVFIKDVYNEIADCNALRASAVEDAKKL